MSERITFEEFSEGVTVAGAGGVGVSIMEPRVKYVRGQVSATPDEGFVACGDGREYCMLVTGATHAEKLDKLEQVFYRVRDAKWESGLITFDIDDTEGSGLEFEYTFQIPTVEPTAELFAARVTASEAFYASVRGYVSVARENLFEHPTVNGSPAGSFGDTYYAGSGFDSYAAADATSEYALWWPEYETFGGVFFALSSFRTGFSFYSEDDPSDASPSLYAIEASPEDGYSSCDAILDIHETVAFIDNDTSGDPLSPANDLYIRPLFRVRAPGFDLRNNSSNEFGDPLAAAGIDLVLELSDSKTLQCPLYYASSVFFIESVIASSDFVLKANKWWLYATKNGDPAWDETTGAPINGGPGA